MVGSAMNPTEGRLQKILFWKSRATLQIGYGLSGDYLALLLRGNRKKPNQRNGDNWLELRASWTLF